VRRRELRDGAAMEGELWSVTGVNWRCKTENPGFSGLKSELTCELH
jgi:hypothetical protein